MLRRFLIRLITGPTRYEESHPLVRCDGCREEFTACELGNAYCPTCGESADGATEVIR